MLYIEKEGLPSDINRKIIELRKSEESKSKLGLKNAVYIFVRN